MYTLERNEHNALPEGPILTLLEYGKEIMLKGWPC